VWVGAIAENKDELMDLLRLPDLEKIKDIGSNCKIELDEH
jgi:hypothetical protein